MLFCWNGFCCCPVPHPILWNSCLGFSLVRFCLDAWFIGGFRVSRHFQLGIIKRSLTFYKEIFSITALVLYPVRLSHHSNKLQAISNIQPCF